MQPRLLQPIYTSFSSSRNIHKPSQEIFTNPLAELEKQKQEIERRMELEKEKQKQAEELERKKQAELEKQK